jgi:GAF domain-containing protein
MNRSQSSARKDDQLLAKMGSRYIQLVMGRSQAASLLIGPPIGLLFTFVTAKLNTTQTIQLLLSLAVLIAVVNIIPPIFTRRATRQARSRLDHIYKGSPLPEGDDANSAWEEIIAIPGRVAISQFISALFLVSLPVALFMRIVGGVNWFQIAAITIGGLMAELAMLIQSVLNLDYRLAPVRRALLPPDAAPKDIRLGIGLYIRHYFVMVFVLLASQLSVGLVVFDKFTSGMAPGASLPGILRQLQLQLGIFGSLTFILGLFLASRLAVASLRPIQEMTRTMELLQKGDLSQRAVVITSDETAKLTIHLNQLLNQLQISQTGLEKQIEERMRNLARKTSYLQAAAWVAHEATALQDINTLLKRTAELISSRFGFYHTGIFLLDDSGAYAILQAASSEGGQRMLARGHKLDVGLQGIVGAAAYQNRSRVVLDVENDKDYYKNPDLSLTRSEAAIPLAARGKILGVLDIQSTEIAAFNQDDVDLLQTMGDQIALAIQNARLITESQETLHRLESATTENIRRIWRENIQGDKHSFRYSSMGLSPVTQLGTTSASDDATSNQLDIPITLRGQRLGTIILRRTTENAWGETDRSLAIEIASQVGLALENARLLDEAQRRAAQEQSLSELSAHLSSSLDPDTILRTVVRELHQLPNVEEVSVFVAPPSMGAPSKETPEN